MELTKTRRALDEIDFLEIGSENWRLRRVRLGSMCMYYSYAEIQVIDYEQAFEKLSEVYEPTKCLSCAIASYGHMKACSNFFQPIAKSLALKIPKHFKEWIEDLTRKRDRIQAHPEGLKVDKTIITHEAIIQKSGIHFPIWKQKQIRDEKRLEIVLNPREDLITLAKLMEFISKMALERYNRDKAVKPS